MRDATARGAVRRGAGVSYAIKLPVSLLRALPSLLHVKSHTR